MIIICQHKFIFWILYILFIAKNTKQYVLWDLFERANKAAFILYQQIYKTVMER